MNSVTNTNTFSYLLRFTYHYNKIMLHLFVALLALLITTPGLVICRKVTCLDDIPSVFPSRLRIPGLNAPLKAWWSKEVTPDFHVCGRMSERQLKYASEAGFKSIVSLFTYPDGDPPGNFGDDILPITKDERHIVEETTGLQFEVLLDPMDEWASVEAVEKFTALVPTLKTPSLLHCDRGYTITFVILMYMANQTRFNPDFSPRIHSKQFYEISASMGLDFLQRIPMEVVSEITGEPTPNVKEQSLLRPQFEPEEWLDYWFAHPVYKNWFITGMIYRSHLQPLVEFEYKSVVNLRVGFEHEGKPGQEEVNLLNVKSKTGTYGDSKTPSRQSADRLRNTLINAKRPNSYINSAADMNYESVNELEFGDSIGYNEHLEREAFKDSPLQYYHLPITQSLKDLKEFFIQNKDQLMDIGTQGPVIVHCSSGQRAARVAVLAAAVQYDLSLEWALQRLKEMGYGMTAESMPEVYGVFEEWLLSADERVEL